MPTPAIAIRLCPHPCPMPGSASISAFTPTTRPRAPRLNSARHAVARPRYCRVTVKPCEDMNSVRRSCAYLGRKRSGRLSDQCPGGESKTNLSSKLSSGWSELCICFLFFFSLAFVWYGLTHHEYPNLTAAARGQVRGVYLRSCSLHWHWTCSPPQTCSPRSTEGGDLSPAVRCQNRNYSRSVRIPAISVIVSLQRPI